jgi:hypothetical protein
MAMAKTTINSSSFFVSSPGKARATIPGHGVKARVSTPGRGINRASTAGDFLAEGNPTSQVGGNNTNRYSSKSLYKTTNTKTIRSEIGSACSIVNFKSFKDIFSGGNHARGFGGASKIFSAQLATNYTRSCPLRFGSGLQAGVDIAPDSKQNQGPSSFFTHRMRKIDIEITALLDKGELNKLEQVSGPFLSNIFLVPQRDGQS